MLPEKLHFLWWFRICVILLCPWAKGEITRTLAADIGFAVPQLVNGSVQVLVWEGWQMGLGYGLIPGLSESATTVALPSSEIPGPAGINFTITPKVKLGLTTLTPFVRYYPHRNNFYMQVAYSLWTLSMNLRGAISHPILGTFPDTALQGNFAYVQPLPTFSVGYIFNGKYGFFNLSIGATIFLNPTVTGSITGVLPEEALALAQEAFDELKTQLEVQLAEQAATLRQQVPYLPSLMLSFGFFL